MPRSSLSVVDGGPVHSFTTEAGNEVRAAIEPDGSSRLTAFAPDGKPLGDGVMFPTTEKRHEFRSQLALLLDGPAEGETFSGARMLAARGAVDGLTTFGVLLSPADYPDLLAALDAIDRAT